jgi:hypothetical protein
MRQFLELAAAWGSRPALRTDEGAPLRQSLDAIEN